MPSWVKQLHFSTRETALNAFVMDVNKWGELNEVGTDFYVEFYELKIF